MIISCFRCGKSYKRYGQFLKRVKHSFCSRKCANIYKSTKPKEYRYSPPPKHFGSDNHRWNNGITFDRYGYRMISMPNYPKANSKGFYPEHRYVMEKHLGRFLDSGELIHHINHNKIDNRIENLMIISRQEHGRLHPPR